jgi:hypothetical protein
MLAKTSKREALERLRSEAENLSSKLSAPARKLFDKELTPGITKLEPPGVLDDLFSIDYRETPVGIREFVNHPYFLGQSLGSALFPVILDDLEELFDGEYSEVLLAGGIGWGKSRMAEVGLCYDLYRLSCLRDPAAAFDLIPGSTLALLNISVTKSQAQKVLFSGMFEIIRRSPYFKKTFPYEPNRTTEIRFPNHITCYPVPSNETSMLGEGVFSAAFDEMNFMPIVEQSKYQAEGGTYDAAETLYTRLSRRILSRLTRKGRLPGHVWLISSPRYPNDFTERKEYEIIHGGAKHIFFRRYAMWETRNRAVFMTNQDGTPLNFKVELGDITRRTRVLDGTETNIIESSVIDNVPMDFHDEFVKDPDKAARDLAGRAVLTIRPFIGRRDLILQMFENGTRIGLQHPFSKMEVTLQEGSKEHEYLLPEHLHFIEEYKDGKTIRRIMPGPYFAHVDLAKNNDAAGLCIGHVVGVVDVKRDMDARLAGSGMPAAIYEKRPVIRIDLLLRIVAPPHGEILAHNVRSIFYRFVEIGCSFGLITYDTWGSHESIQLLQAQGYNSDNYSVDRTPDAYETLKAAMYDQRILCYPNQVLQQELSSLLQNEKTGKIDHPPNGSKDLADALAGTVKHCDNFLVAGIDVKALAPSRARLPNKEETFERWVRTGQITMEDFDRL